MAAGGRLVPGNGRHCWCRHRVMALTAKVFEPFVGTGGRCCDHLQGPTSPTPPFVGTGEPAGTGRWLPEVGWYRGMVVIAGASPWKPPGLLVRRYRGQPRTEPMRRCPRRLSTGLPANPGGLREIALYCTHARFWESDHWTGRRDDTCEIFDRPKRGLHSCRAAILWCQPWPVAWS